MNKLICLSAVTLTAAVQSQTTSWNVTTPMEVEAMVLTEEELIEQFIENPQQFLEDLQKDTMPYNALLQMSGMKATEFDTTTEIMIQYLKSNPEAEKEIQKAIRDQFIKEEETLMKSEDIFKPRMVETRRMSDIQEA